MLMRKRWSGVGPDAVPPGTGALSNRVYLARCQRHPLSRMEAAMAAMANELHAPEAEDDLDFSVEKCSCFHRRLHPAHPHVIPCETVEEDISASDFESTDEEEQARELEQAEKDSLQTKRQVTKVVLIHCRLITLLTSGSQLESA